MTGTFSTMINFSLLGILNRIHKLQIQEDLKSKVEKDEHCIYFPRQANFGNSKDGHQVFEEFKVADITIKEIEQALLKGEDKAKHSIELLGMMEDLKANNQWDIPPLAECMKGESYDSDIPDDDDEENSAHAAFKDLGSIELEIEDIETLANNKMISESVKRKAEAQKVGQFNDIGIPLYEIKSTENNDEDIAIPDDERSIYVTMTVNEKSVRIRKQTVVWLLQETDSRVSTDRLYRVQMN